MDYEALRTVVYKLNEDEQFYKKYYYAKQQEYSLQEFLSTINIDDVLRRHLLVPEIKKPFLHALKIISFLMQETTFLLL